MAAYTMRTFVLVLQLMIAIPVVLCLYEDQIGKFDWKQQFIGKAKFSHVESGTSKRFIFVATEANVLAGLSARTGQIAWRQVFKRGAGGIIDALLYNSEDLITLSGGGRVLRSWDPSTGYLRWEMPTTTQAASQQGVSATLAEGEDGSIVAVLAGGTLYIHNAKDGVQLSTQTLPNSETANYRWLQAEEASLHSMGVVNHSHISVATYHTGDESVTNQMALPAAWATQESSCTIVSCHHIVCIDQLTNSLQHAPVKGASIFSAMPLTTLGLTTSQGAVVSALYPSSCQRSEFILKLNPSHHVLLKVSGSQVQIAKDLENVHTVTGSLHGDKVVMALASLKSDNEMELSCYIDGEETSNLEQKVEISGSHGQPEQMTLMLYEKRDHHLGFRALVQTADHTLMLLHGGHMTWHREEALPGAVAVEMVDLPVSDTEAKFEDEFGAEPEESIATMFLRRLSTQFAQLQSFISHVKRRIQHGAHHGHVHHESATPSSRDDSDDDDDDDEYYLTRDDFNLHKILLVVTKASKLYGLDSNDGSIVWSYFLSELQPFEVRGQPKLLLFVQRTTAHFPHPPQCTVIGKDKTTGNGYLYSFNPITGKPSHEDAPHGTVLPYQIKQATMLGLTDEDFLKVILLMDTDNMIHTYPASDAATISEHKDSIYIFTGDTYKGTFEGFKLGQPGDETGSYHSDLVWNIQLPSDSQNVTHILSKRQTEHVHSQGRVLGDRSVLYKYLNPNLVAIVTEGEDTGAKAHLHVYLMDVVTGNILFHTDHKRASGPVHLVHAENWVVYHYWNTRHRRHEMTVLELYEGKDQKNSTVFSSLDPPNSPMVERQSYIISSAVQAMEPTYTERGITQKHILVVLSSGGILSLPKRMLDPRRPLVPTTEHREEGLIPYLPELGIPHQSLVNYNQSLSGIEGIHTAPAGLESTCLVLAYGLDYYFTRVTPSKLFDVLKEDFDYMFISTVLLGLVVASYVTRRLAAMRALRQAWK